MSFEMITDVDRYPTLSDEGRRMLQFLREHPHAPLFRNESGHRLTPDDLITVRKFEKELESAEVSWMPGQYPSWVGAFVDKCFREVPFYRRYGPVPREFGDLPAITRADLGQDIAQFVPDTVSIDRLINFRTSGTTGHPMLIASHPVVAANYLAFHKRALRRFGIELHCGRGQVGVVLVGFQRKCFTYVSVTPSMNESGLAKINLHPDDWRDPDDRAKYLNSLNAEVYTGDPLSFAELARLPLNISPAALLSTSMTLLPSLRREWEALFKCPVLDLYSMNEAGPVAVYDDKVEGHVLLQPNLYVELLDGDGHALPLGERGEITLTGGFNFCLPLLRYRTGDFASLRRVGTELVLDGLEGRPPTRFRNASGEWFNNIEITHTLQRYAIAQFTLHQNADYSLVFRFVGTRGPENQIRNSLLELFGPNQPLVVEVVSSFEGKVVQYTSDVEGAQP